ncbi:MAG: UDP-glucose dehydrogenase family protein [Acidimicrobiia bacterium]
MSTVGVVGAGYVGLTTAACFAHLGHDVACADVDTAKLTRLSRGEIPFMEEGLAGLVEAGLRSERLRFVDGAAEAAAGPEFVFLCVPTPAGPEDAADLSCVHEAVAEVAPVMEAGSVLVAKSTMPPGSSRQLARALKEAGAVGRGVAVATNPEFLREGTAVFDFLHPDRVVVGCDDPAVAMRVARLYDDLGAPVLVTGCASAEMIKYAANAFLATRVSFINAVANLCEVLDADVREVSLGMGYDPRIGFDFLRPGPGFGGSCLPKDTAALIRVAEAAGYDFSLLRGTMEVNRAQPERMVAKIAAAASVTGGLSGAQVAVWGLAFKAHTDDLRHSPALAVAERLVKEGATVRAYDPAVSSGAVQPFTVLSDPYSAVEGADVLAVLTEWDTFRWVDFERVRALMRNPAVVDTRNLLDPASLRRLGFSYQGVGR